MGVTTDSRRWTEIACVLLVAAGKFVFMDWLQYAWQFILFIVGGCLWYILVRKGVDKSIVFSWGFRWDNFKSVTKGLLPWAIVAVVASFIIGYARDSILFHWHFFPTLLYPLWGVFQQYLCMALVAGNLRQMNAKPIKNVAIILITSTLFGLMHLPDPWLAGATFVMALIYSWHYIREQNLYVLGLFHGLLGTIFYFIALGKDPWLRVWGEH